MCLVVGCRGGGPGTGGRRRLCGERRLWVLARDFGRVGGEVAADMYCRSGAPRRPASLLLMKTSALLSWLALLWSDLWPCGRGVERGRGKLLSSTAATTLTAPFSWCRLPPWRPCRGPLPLATLHPCGESSRSPCGRRWRAVVASLPGGVVWGAWMQGWRLLPV